MGLCYDALAVKGNRRFSTLSTADSVERVLSFVEMWMNSVENHACNRGKMVENAGSPDLKSNAPHEERMWEKFFCLWESMWKLLQSVTNHQKSRLECEK